MELLIILYLAYAHLVHPLETRQHYPLQLDRTDERVIAWEKSVQKYEKKRIEIGETESPIIPLYVRDLEKTFIVTKRAFDEGVFINSVIPPACAPQDTLIRFSLMATHTREQVDRAVTALTKVFKEEGIIK